MSYSRKADRVPYKDSCSFPPPFTASPARSAFYSSSVSFPGGWTGLLRFVPFDPRGSSFSSKIKEGRSFSLGFDPGRLSNGNHFSVTIPSFPPGVGLPTYPGNFLKLSRSVVFSDREAAFSPFYFKPASLDLSLSETMDRLFNTMENLKYDEVVLRALIGYLANKYVGRVVSPQLLSRIALDTQKWLIAGYYCTLSYPEVEARTVKEDLGRGAYTSVVELSIIYEGTSYTVKIGRNR